jgi:phage-related protein
MCDSSRKQEEAQQQVAPHQKVQEEEGNCNTITAAAADLKTVVIPAALLVCLAPWLYRAACCGLPAGLCPCPNALNMDTVWPCSTALAIHGMQPGGTV